MSAALNLDHVGREDYMEASRPHLRPGAYVYRDPRSIPPRQWLYGGHYIRKYVSATVAPGGLGKTLLALVEVVAMVTGRDLLGSRPRHCNRAWYFNLEDPLEEVERRLAAILLHYAIAPSEIEGRLFINSGREGKLTIAEKLGDNVVVMLPVVDDLISGIREHGIDVVTIDPFVSSHGVPENDNGAIDRVVKTWAHIAEVGNCSVELIHHVRKASNGASGDYTVDDARGAVALIGAVRSARVLNIMSKDDASRVDVSAEERFRYFRVDNGKSNMTPPLDKAVWRKLVSVDLGNGTNEEPSDNVGVATSWTMPGLFEGLTTLDLRKVQARIMVGTWAESSQAGNWAGRAVAEALDLPAGT
jgi:hypothetical protein